MIFSGIFWNINRGKQFNTVAHGDASLNLIIIIPDPGWILWKLREGDKWNQKEEREQEQFSHVMWFEMGSNIFNCGQFQAFRRGRMKHELHARPDDWSDGGFSRIKNFVEERMRTEGNSQS